MKTIIHAYRFDILTPEGKAGYSELCERMKQAGIKCFETHGGASHWMQSINGQELTLDIKHVFDNQWNTEPFGESKSGLRVFDWAQDYRPNGSATIKRGHYLDITEEMRELRKDIHACGYCGFQCSAKDATPFCPRCIGSEYLKVSDLPLTRMKRVSSKSNRAPLTEQELAERLPLYKSAQMFGNTERDKKRIAAKRADILKKRDSTIKNANMEFDGQTWLMDRGITADPIFYNHTGRFGFGWRAPVDPALIDDLRESLKDFPFPYDIK